MSVIKVTPLGTVSPYCKDNKNCPGFMIDNGITKILLDCGNGITRYMNMETDLNNLIVIISHLHKDHYGDILALAYASYVYHNLGYLDKKIDVYIPFDDSFDYQYLHNLGVENYLNIKDYDELSKINLSDMQVSFKRTAHNIKTYASCIKTKDYKLCYSADTGYDDTLISFFKDADLFICESTFLKGQNKVGNNHLYADEAAMLAKESDVKLLMLTHFWPEINASLYLSEAQNKFKNTITAEEGKTIVLKRKGWYYDK